MRNVEEEVKRDERSVGRVIATPATGALAVEPLVADLDDVLDANDAQLSMLDEWSSNILVTDPMRVYRSKRDAARKRVTDKYSILGFISSGTYGRVYKAQSKESDGRIHAIKKFKPDKEGDVVTYTGISQSAIREIAVRTYSVSLSVFPHLDSIPSGYEPLDLCMVKPASTTGPATPSVGVVADL